MTSGRFIKKISTGRGQKSVHFWLRFLLLPVGESSGKASKGQAKYIPGSALHNAQAQAGAVTNEFAKTRMVRYTRVDPDLPHQIWKPKGGIQARPFDHQIYIQLSYHY